MKRSFKANTGIVHAIEASEKDNVATAIIDIRSGTMVNVTIGRRITSLLVEDNVPSGHKFATQEIEKGKEVLKYGYPIGLSTQLIKKGHHVHTHNIRSLRGIPKASE